TSALTNPRSSTSSSGSNATSAASSTTGPHPASPCAPPSAAPHSSEHSHGRISRPCPPRKQRMSLVRPPGGAIGLRLDRAHADKSGGRDEAGHQMASGGPDFPGSALCRDVASLSVSLALP